MGKLLQVWKEAAGQYQQTRTLLQSSQIPHAHRQEFMGYLNQIGREDRAQLRRLLRQRLDLDPIHLEHFFQTPIGDAILNYAGVLVQATGDRDGKQALKQLLLEMAADPEGLSILNLLRKLPPELRFDTERIRLTAQQIAQLYRDTGEMVAAVEQLATAETATAQLSEGFPTLDLCCPGEFGIAHQTLQLHPKALHPFRVQLYWPTVEPKVELKLESKVRRSGKGCTPVVIISHGLGSCPEGFSNYAKHLVSHGYAVAIPEHRGSNLAQLQAMLAGETPEVFRLNDFLDRPAEITAVLDELERLNRRQFHRHLNLRSVGIMGHSLGGYTALALAGAEIHFDKLEQACHPRFNEPNASLLVQCRALRLPRQTYNFRDSRVTAVLPINPVSSEVFGPEGIAQIQIPVLIVAGSADRTAPALLEQIRLLPWLSTPHRYLALIRGKTHTSDFAEQMEIDSPIQALPSFSEPDPTHFYPYLYGLSLAFFEVHAAHNDEFCPYLQAAYAATISQPPFDLSLISAQSIAILEEQLQTLASNRTDFNLNLQDDSETADPLPTTWQYQHSG